MLRGMAADFSWEVAAKSYSALYSRLLAGVNP
jgi:glycogen synthase